MEFVKEDLIKEYGPEVDSFYELVEPPKQEVAYTEKLRSWLQDQPKEQRIAWVTVCTRYHLSRYTALNHLNLSRFSFSLLFSQEEPLYLWKETWSDLSITFLAGRVEQLPQNILLRKDIPLFFCTDIKASCLSKSNFWFLGRTPCPSWSWKRMERLKVKSERAVQGNVGEPGEEGWRES